jgi:hypothetical protein
MEVLYKRDMLKSGSLKIKFVVNLLNKFGDIR